MTLTYELLVWMLIVLPGLFPVAVKFGIEIGRLREQDEQRKARG